MQIPFGTRQADIDVSIELITPGSCCARFLPDDHDRQWHLARPPTTGSIPKRSTACMFAVPEGCASVDVWVPLAVRQLAMSMRRMT